MNMNQNKKGFVFRNAVTIVFFLSLLFLVSGCSGSSKGTEAEQFTAREDFEGRNIAVLTGTIMDQILDGAIDDLEYKYYDDYSSQLEALKKGDVDGIGTDLPMAELVVAQRPEEFAIFPEILADDSYGYILKKGSELTPKFTEIITRFEEDGTLEALKTKWFSGNEDIMKIDWEEYQITGRSGGTLRYTYDPISVPMGYIADDGSPTGYEVELLLKIADVLDMNVEITRTNFSSLINFIQTDKADVASGSISITGERKEEVDFPTSHYIGGTVLVCRRENVAEASVEGVSGEAAAEGGSSFLSGLRESFEKTFLRESRWKLVVNGLAVTLEISVCAGIIGTVLGFLLCLCLRSRKSWLALPVKVFFKLLQGIPSLVVLMITYFIIFGSVSVNAVIVAIIAFSVMFAASVAEILNTGIEAVDKGQWEAAVSLGFGKAGTFGRIIMPQAVRHVLPLYKGEFVSMMKLTSIVGYISIEDLTKAGDIVRSRTYEAFFPLIATAAIYFAVSSAVTFGIGRVEVKINPKPRPRRLPKGVCAEESTGGESGAVRGIYIPDSDFRHGRKGRAGQGADPH